MNAQPALQLLLIDDHALLRTGLRLVLESALPGVRIGEAGSMAEALHTPDAKLDLVLLDIELPGLNGLQGITLLKRQWPTTPIIIVTSHAEADARTTAVAQGAAAFLSKSEPTGRMVAVIQAVLAGDPVTEPTAASPVSPTPLTARQCEVLDQLCLGHSNKIIGRHLNLSENTVRGHVAGLLAALGVSSRTEAVAVARQRGLVR
ncbi:response regulator transcription factor [Dyella mobilis]|uniref:Response regulator transcription factor n=1 Tax=Dyella mobilis TaxID=1849582 RepID=A0ABS2KGA5_9GAMM|nr:response regulator transcription factor [Dyella mobilis]MBM7129943.1 response regulator transcription factor [Dyella mobilis]GLQ97794.1 DNA-binding response regulator [Dyella mobilis]